MPGFFRGFRPLDAMRNLASPQGSAGHGALDSPHDIVRDRPLYSPDDTWARKSISLDIADRFIGLLSEEIKLRGVLEPLVLLPWRPNYDLMETKRFVHRILGEEYDLDLSEIQREVKIADVFVIASALKWIWARIPDGIVTWDVYELFKAGEEDSGNPQHAFKAIIPVVADSPARSRIIFNFFDLLSAIAAHWKTSGMGGRKIARLAAWWAFPLREELACIGADSDNVYYAAGSSQTLSLPSFSEAYKIWSKAAEASAHLFFGYLRSQSAAPTAALTWPIALSTLLSSTPYPPTTSNSFSSTEALLLSAFVTSYSFTPRDILQRFHGFARRNPNVGEVSADDTAVEAYLYGSPSTSTAGIDSFLTDEFTRILNDVCSYMTESEDTGSAASMGYVKPINSNASIVSSPRGTSKKDSIRSARSPCSEEWSHFQDHGFWISNLEQDPRQPRTRNHTGSSDCSTESSTGPETPTAPHSWTQFVSRGFPTGSSPTLSNPELSLPSVESLFRAPTRHRKGLQPPRAVGTEADAIQQPLEISKLPLDDAFWWTWLCAHGPEELSSRRLIFATHVVVEFDAAACENSSGLSDLNKRDRLVIFEERLSANTKSGLQERSVPQIGRNGLRRFASRSFKFLNRTEPTIVVATAAAGVRLRDRPSLLSLYREYQSSNPAPSAMTVNVVSERSPGAERVKRLREAVHGTAPTSQIAGVRPDEAADLKPEMSRDQNTRPEEGIPLFNDTRWKHHVSMVIEVDEEISRAVQWANSERSDSTSDSQLAQPDKMLPTPTLSPQPRRISTAICVADVLRETSSPSPTISAVKKGRSFVAHKRKKLTLKGSALLRRKASNTNIPSPLTVTAGAPSEVTAASVEAYDAKYLGYGKMKKFMARFKGKSGTRQIRTSSAHSEVRHLQRGTSDVDDVPIRRKSPKNDLLSPLVSGAEPGEISSANISMNPGSEVEGTLPAAVADLQLSTQFGQKDEDPGSSWPSKTRQLAPPKSPQAQLKEDPFDFQIMSMERRNSSHPLGGEATPLAKSSALNGSPAPRPGVVKRKPISPRMRSQPLFPDSPTMIQPIFPSATSGPVLLPPYSGRSSSALRTYPPFSLPPASHLDASQVQRISQLMVQATAHGTDMAETHGVGSSMSQHMRYSEGPSGSAIASRTARPENPSRGSSRWATITADARDRARRGQYQPPQQHAPYGMRLNQQPPPRNNRLTSPSYAISGFVPRAEWSER
ncbi:hypothetical protein V1525DRAFT_62260 [Lipomyces kononenkoae]|uniref:Uncharacterized protein n=1 Tax=Lipomyces kononenkoae TaxID=34357 RepID=A0ACC3T5L9_LIPKO